MNDASQWRYKLAQQVAPIYAANPHVAAVLVGGSTARGHAGRFSDIELGVFWLAFAVRMLNLTTNCSLSITRATQCRGLSR